MNNRRKFWSRIAMLAGAWIAVSQIAGAASVTVPQLQPGQTNPTGLQVKIEPDWIDNCGYRPIRVLVTVMATTPQERDLTIRLTCEPMYYQRGLSQTVVGRVVIPPGAAVGQSFPLILSLPECPFWYNAKLEVLEGGRPRDELTANGISLSTLGYGSQRGMEDQVAGIRYESIQIRLTGSNPANSLPMLAHAELPVRWLDYSGIEVAYSSKVELENLFKNFPDKAIALRRWTAVGGILCITGMTSDWDGLETVEKLLQLKVLDASDKRRGWESYRATQQKTAPVPSDQPPPREDRDEPDRTPPRDEPDRIDPSPIRAAPPVVIESAVTRELGLGLVIASQDSTFDLGSSWGRSRGNGSRYQLQDASRTNWEHRHGIKYEEDNGDFWNFLIPGVGFAPVWQFLTLISLFVVVVGPVNYYLLKKWKRIPLLLITVPAAAVLVTVGLIGYAFLADGLGVRVRTRSYTEIDQPSGEAVCWSRLSYYAGMAPAGGLTFHDDTAVYPLPAWSLEADETSVAHRETIWDGDKQRLASGWLNSRTPTQFITVRARQTPARLNVQATADGGAVKVNNLLGTRIQDVLVVDSAGKTFAGKDIAADKIATLAAINSAEAGNAIRDAIEAHEPRVPEEVAYGQNSGNWGSPRSRRYYYPKSSADSVLPAVSQGTSRMETTITQLLEKVKQKKFEPRTYIAIVDRSPEVEIGLDSARDEASFHIIVGRW